MRVIDNFLLNVRKAETPFYARLKSFAKSLMHMDLAVPAPILSLYNVLSYLRLAVRRTWTFFAVLLYRAPMFRSRCVSVGKRLSIERMPHIVGTPRIVVGDDVRISGVIGIAGGRTVDNPEIVFGSRVFIGHQTHFVIAKQIVIEEGAAIAANCYIADNDGHARDLESRLKGLPPLPDEVKPVRICRNAWLGRGSYVLKGVTIGEGAIVGVGSIVISDIPPFTVAMGNPARVVQRLQT
jgi:acetyltransferase-like isoleucine patch superfamily enzyme